MLEGLVCLVQDEKGLVRSVQFDTRQPTLSRPLVSLVTLTHSFRWNHLLYIFRVEKLMVRIEFILRYGYIKKWWLLDLFNRFGTLKKYQRKKSTPVPLFKMASRDVFLPSYVFMDYNLSYLTPEITFYAISHKCWGKLSFRIAFQTNLIYLFAV